MIDKHSINLLQPELMPEQPLWTLTRVALIWTLTFVLMLVWLAISQYQLKSSTTELRALQQQKRKIDNQVSALETRLTNHKAANDLVARLTLLKHVAENKKSLLAQLSDGQSTFVAGFALAMTELAQLHHQDISLTNVEINSAYMSFSGIARNAESVPAWLNRFEQSSLLSGKNFVNFSMVENEHNITEFSVSTKAVTGASE